MIKTIHSINRLHHHHLHYHSYCHQYIHHYHLPAKHFHRARHHQSMRKVQCRLAQPFGTGTDLLILLILLMNCFIFSNLLYCSTVCSNTSRSNIKKLQLVQNFPARIVLGLLKFDHISQGIRSLNWLPVCDRLYLNYAIMIFKCIHNLVPDYLAEKFTFRSQINIRNTRQSNILGCRLATGQRSFSCRGAKLWNNLSNGLKNVNSVKAKLTKQLLLT